MIDDAIEQNFSLMVPPPETVEDPHSEYTRRIAADMQLARARMSAKKARYLELLFHGKTKAEASKETGLKAPALRLKDPASPEYQYMVALRMAYRLEQGPTVAMRKTLLWKIAVDQREKSPASSVKAVDTLNRMDNLYANDDSPQLTINNNVYQDLPWDKLAALVDAQKTIEHVPPDSERLPDASA